MNLEQDGRELFFGDNERVPEIKAGAEAPSRNQAW